MTSLNNSDKRTYHSKKVDYYNSFFKYTPSLSLIEFGLVFLQDFLFLKVKYGASFIQVLPVLLIFILCLVLAVVYEVLFNILKKKDRNEATASCGYIFLYAILLLNIFEMSLLPDKSNTVSRILAFTFNIFIYGNTVSRRFYIPGTLTYSIYPVFLYLGISFFGPRFGLFQDSSFYQPNINLFSLEFMTVPFIMVIYLLNVFYDHSFKKELNSLEHLENLANQDQLTSLCNRNFFMHLTVDDRFENLIDPDVYFYMIDIDFFKKINDTWGHNRGDEVLKQLSSIIKDNIRSEDVAVRWGGEEILVVVKGNLDENKVLDMAERIRLEVERTGFFTISIGVCHYNKEENITRNINVVDEALYASKDAGRNKITFLPE